MIAQLAEVGKTSSILELVGVILEYFWAGKGLLRVNKIRIFHLWLIKICAEPNWG